MLLSRFPRISLAHLPTPLERMDRLSKELRKNGFTFVGTTICYAFLQATGMVNDHLADCFCRRTTTS